MFSLYVYTNTEVVRIDESCMERREGKRPLGKAHAEGWGTVEG